MKFRLPLLPPLIRWFAAACVAIFIFYTSIVTVPPETTVDTVQPEFVALDKWRHFVAYGTLGYALAYALADQPINRWTRGLVVVGFILVYGVGIEVGQYFIAYRSFNVNDMMANAIGACLIFPWIALWPYIRLVPISNWLQGSYSNTDS